MNKQNKANERNGTIKQFEEYRTTQNKQKQQQYTKWNTY